MMIGQGLDPQNNRNKCKLVWDSSSSSRARTRAQVTVPAAVGLVKSQTAQKVQFTQRSSNTKTNVVPAKVGLKPVESSHTLNAQNQTRRRSISDIIANRMSMFEENQDQKVVTKKKKKSVNVQVNLIRTECLH